ncbi:cell wall-active antibiotics response protein LiaF [Paenibacillus senegalensis]|uniref:cell wall-active antibiotics response protein LiaF n=1 Tax=Paenibacillus senegalensis TaxID=1465766 RepID=UPI000288A532|nr:cell wall-active antibiotics response protein LiaF [Paenibacillus senegalensis]
MDSQSNNRNRNTYLLLIGAGVFLLIQHLFGFQAIVALILIAIGIYYLQSQNKKRGYILLAAGLLFIIGDSLAILVALVFISLGLFYLKSTQQHKDSDFIKKQSFMESIKYDQGPWELKNTSIWFLVGEVNMDVSLAIFDGSDITLALQGIVGDVELIIPEDVGVILESSVMVGLIQLPYRKEEGVLNKVEWVSPNYDTAEQRIKIELSYIVADVKIKMI